jgi:hypothetical protein
MGCSCRWAPLRVPLTRRLQTLAIAIDFPPLTLLYCVFLWACIMIFAGIYVRTVLVLYTAWCFLDHTPSRGGWNVPRLTKFLRSTSLHRCVRVLSCFARARFRVGGMCMLSGCVRVRLLKTATATTATTAVPPATPPPDRRHPPTLLCA